MLGSMRSDPESKEPSDFDASGRSLTDKEWLNLRHRRHAARMGEPRPPLGGFGAYDGERYRKHGRGA